MFCLHILDAEEGVVGTGEEGAGLLVVVVRESIRGVGVRLASNWGWGLDPEAPYGSVDYLPVLKGGFAHW